jgi:hypothetical protein
MNVNLTANKPAPFAMNALTTDEAGKNSDNIIHKTKTIPFIKQMSQTDKRDLVQW